MVLWMMSPSTRAVEVSRTLRPRTRPITRPFTTMSSATISPLIVALSPTVKRCARMSPSTTPSTWMSPEVFTLPVMVRSAERTEAPGFGFGAVDMQSKAGFEAADSGAFGGSAGVADLGPGSLILLLENIVGRLDKRHRVHSSAARAHLIVEMGAGGAASIPHITDPVPA